MAASAQPDRNPEWGPIQPIPPVRRGTSKRRARSRGMHMGQFFAMSDEERRMTYEISKVGRRR